MGFVNSSHRGLLWGVFNQNVFSFAGDDERADVNLSIVQPILNLSLGDGWSVGASEMNVTYDWEQDDFVSLPLGVGVSKLTRRFGPAIQFNLQYEHDFADEYIGPEDTISFRVRFFCRRDVDRFSASAAGARMPGRGSSPGHVVRPGAGLGKGPMGAQGGSGFIAALESTVGGEAVADHEAEMKVALRRQRSESEGKLAKQ